MLTDDRMLDVVAHVGEQCPARLHARHIRERLFEVQMRGVRLEAERVEDQQIQSFQCRQRVFRDRVAIRDERKFRAAIAKAKTAHFTFAVDDRNRRDAQATHVEGLKVLNRMRRDLRQAAADLFGFEDIKKHAAQFLPRAFAGKGVERAVLEVEGPNIIQPKHVIGVAMRNQQRIQLGQFGAQGLLPKVGRNINHDVLAFVFDQQTGAQSFVARIGRRAGRAFTSDHRHADGGSGSEES